MKFSFFTYCDDEFQTRFGTRKLINSIRYFHPNYNIILYGSKEIEKVHEKYNVNIGNALPCMMLEAKREHNLDYIIHLDSDSLCLSYLKEILKFDYEIASARNNCDTHTGCERQNRPSCLWELPNNKYVNCGLTATNSEKFLLQWIELNEQITKSGGIKAFWQADIQWFNFLFHYGNYNSKILDPQDSNIFYGPSANMYDKDVTDNPEHIIKEYKINGWQSWKKIEYNEENGNFYLYGNLTRLIHMCGGGNKDSVIKCSLDMFNDKVKERLQEITGFKE